MKKLLPVAVIAAAAIAVPAFAAKPANPGSPATTHNNSNNSHSKRCKHSTLHKGYVFGGTLTSVPTITQTAGQGTASKSDDRYDVTLSFTVGNANKYAKGDHPKGSTFSDTIHNVRVSFGQNTDATPRTPQIGDHVNVKGKHAFKVKKNCTADPNDPVGGTTFQKVSFGDQPTP
jgi:hypothetical protein